VGGKKGGNYVGRRRPRQGQKGQTRGLNIVMLAGKEARGRFGIKDLGRGQKRAHTSGKKTKKKRIILKESEKGWTKPFETTC